MTRRLLACALLVLAPPLFADDEFSPAHAACMDASDGVTSSMVDCIRTEHEAQDGRLNAAYRALGDDLTDARRTQLVAAQRAWLRYRDANCAFYADPDGGTLARVLANECVLRMTARRADELEQLAAPGE